MDKSSYVRRRNLDAPNILLNDSFVSAGGFDEKGLEPVNYLCIGILDMGNPIIVPPRHASRIPSRGNVFLQQAD